MSALADRIHKPAKESPEGEAESLDLIGLSSEGTEMMLQVYLHNLCG